MRCWNDEPAGPRVLNSLSVDVTRNAAEFAAAVELLTGLNHPSISGSGTGNQSPPCLLWPFPFPFPFPGRPDLSELPLP